MRHDTLAIEDDVYGELRYVGETLPALYSFAPDHVLYVSSVSKVFSPAMRIGFAVMPPAVLDRVLALKPSIDMQTSVFNQALVADFIEGGYMDNHIEKVKETYINKRTLMLDALSQHMPADFTWNEGESSPHTSKFYDSEYWGCC